MNELETVELQAGNGIWKILKKGDEICIADPQGRERHRSNGHINTAVHLAMRMADLPIMPLSSNLDECLRNRAEMFEKGKDPTLVTGFDIEFVVPLPVMPDSKNLDESLRRQVSRFEKGETE